MNCLNNDLATQHALQQAVAVDEVKEIRDKAEALRLYARQRNDTEMELGSIELVAPAGRRIG